MPIQAPCLSIESVSTFIETLFPRMHGHMVKALTAYVLALVLKTSGCQAELARAFDNHEAATRRLTRLLHNPRLCPRQWADTMLAYALDHLPRHGPVRLVIDWTSEASQNLLVVSVVIGRRTLPVYWRAYGANVLKGRMGRYERAVLRRVLTAVVQHVGKRRVHVLADRGFADAELCAFLNPFGVLYVLRAKASTKVEYHRQWQKLGRIGFVGNARYRELGHVRYCQSAPQRLWVTLARQHHAGKWRVWYLLSNRPLSAPAAAEAYGFRFCTEEGFRDAKWWLGFAQAHIRDTQAWSRLFGLCVLTMWLIMLVAHPVLLAEPDRARRWLRQVSARRRERWTVSVFKAMLCLLQQSLAWLTYLTYDTRLNLEAHLPNVS